MRKISAQNMGGPVRRSISSSDIGERGDRATTPGVGEDPRDTLPEPQPPIAPSDFSRTIPMGSAVTSQWVAEQIARSQQSGVHALEGGQTPPRTPSDRVPGQGSKHKTLASFSAAPPPVIESDDKRWIGSGVDQDLGRTQRTFSVPPATDAHAPTLFLAGSPPAPASFGSTLRTLSVPPPAAGAATAPTVSSARTINVSPEIEIPPTRQSDRPGTPIAVPPPLPSQRSQPTSDRPTAREIPAARATDPGLTPMINPGPVEERIEAPPILVEPQPGGLPTRWLLIGLGVCALAIGAILLATRPSAPPVPAAPAETAAPAESTPPALGSTRPATPTDLGRATEIVSNPPGAEIVLRGALVANAPAKINRPSHESLYLVRLRGYQPQLVALSPHSPDTIRIELQPLPGVTEPPAMNAANPGTTPELQALPRGKN